MGHQAGGCTGYKCKTCDKPHKTQKKELEINSQNNNEKEMDSKVSLYNKSNQIVLLSTAILELKRTANTWIEAKVLVHNQI